MYTCISIIYICVCVCVKVKVLVTQSCPTLYDSMDCSPPGSFLCPWYSPGKNTGVCSHYFFQWIFQTQGLKPGLLHYRQICLPSDSPGNPLKEVQDMCTLSHVKLFMTLSTVAHWAPLSMGFFRQDHQSGCVCVIVCLCGPFRQRPYCPTKPSLASRGVRHTQTSVLTSLTNSRLEWASPS